MVAEVSPGVARRSFEPLVPEPHRTTFARETAQYDAELVRRYNTGQDVAFNEIIGRYHRKLAAFSFTILRNHADAEEIAQDTLIRAHRHLRDFRGDCSLSSWLHTIAFNLSRNRYSFFSRRGRQVTQSLDCAISANSPDSFIDLAASETPGPVAEATARELSSLVATCIGQLSPLHREILERRILDAASYEEIAIAFGIHVGTVKSRIARARTKLRELLALACPEFAPDTEPFEWLECGRQSGGLQ